MPDIPDDVAERRSILYAYTGLGGQLTGDVRHGLTALRADAASVTVVHAPGIAPAVSEALAALSDRVVTAATSAFSAQWYDDAMGSSPLPVDDEIVLTGDSCFGPLPSLREVSDRMRAADLDLWQLVENRDGVPESFAPQGFPATARPWMWTVVRGRLAGSVVWREGLTATGDDEPGREYRIVAESAQRGARTGYAFEAAAFPSNHPALHDAELLLAAGCPFVDKAPFQGYPPYLNRQAIIGRDIAQTVAAAGYPQELVWESLARSTPPKTLNSNAGMLEVIAEDADGYDPARPFRIAVVARVTWLDGLDGLLARIAHLPQPVDVFLTTTEGTSAAKIERAVESWSQGRDGRVEVRVTTASRGRDMADFFVACRDVLLSDRYDLIVKLHARKARRKTMNRARYFRRYQLDNLLVSRTYARNLLALFQQEPGLGVVFPPMMHIGYATMGHGWAELRDDARALCDTLGITVPLDPVSPLAPFGGMWVGRPAAMRVLAEYPWTFGDYSRRRQKRFGHLGHLQERLVAYAAAERGFHTRTVLNTEHAAISHTALEFKADELFSTTRGYPVEQIQLLHRAGYTGHGGPVALVRMYVRINHPRVAGLLRPLYHLAFRAFGVLAAVRRYVLGRAGRVEKESM